MNFIQYNMSMKRCTLGTRGFSCVVSGVAREKTSGTQGRRDGKCYRKTLWRYVQNGFKPRQARNASGGFSSEVHRVVDLFKVELLSPLDIQSKETST